MGVYNISPVTNNVFFFNFIAKKQLRIGRSDSWQAVKRCLYYRYIIL